MNIPAMMTATTVANLSLQNSVRKTYNGTERDLENGDIQVREFKFTLEDIGKFIVVKHRYEEHFLFNTLGTQLTVNGHKLSTHKDDYLYGVYEIHYHDWCENEKNISYKIYLKPIEEFTSWCPDRSWYTYDTERDINLTYNLFEENPVFDNAYEAFKFAMKKNFELYPDTRSWFRKMINKIFNK